MKLRFSMAEFLILFIVSNIFSFAVGMLAAVLNFDVADYFKSEQVEYSFFVSVILVYFILMMLILMFFGIKKKIRQ